MVVDEDDAPGAHRRTAPSETRSSTSVPSPGSLETTVAEPPARSMRPWMDSREPRRSGGDGRGVEAHAAVADEDGDRRSRLDLDVDVDPPRRRRSFAAFVIASRGRRARPRRPWARRPRCASSTGTPRSVLDVGRRGRERRNESTEPSSPSGRCGVEPAAELALLPRGRARRRASARPAWRWISASVWSTESWMRARRRRARRCGCGLRARRRARGRVARATARR